MCYFFTFSRCLAAATSCATMTRLPSAIVRLAPAPPRDSNCCCSCCCFIPSLRLAGDEEWEAISFLAGDRLLVLFRGLLRRPFGLLRRLRDGLIWLFLLAGLAVAGAFVVAVASAVAVPVAGFVAAVALPLVVIIVGNSSGDANATGGDCKGGIVVGKALGESCWLLLAVLFGVSSVKLMTAGPVSVGAAVAVFSFTAGLLLLLSLPSSVDVWVP